ncbi:Small-conductance mechanosensitive channel [Paraoerskovia marina]|uniref:Small-conductance mechanosensitive channel n=1 Tax=Paraoerskovia marina TaxID=545619 RepID=A0A1H1W2W3_9CELL|nr:Small-conductance mechanosensitive channel [Paraoerskovia marina]
MDDPDIPEAVQDAYSVGVTLVAAAVGLLIAMVFVAVAGFLIRRLGKRSRLMRDLALRLRRPIRAVLMVVALIVAVRVSVPAAADLAEGESEIWWRGPLLHLLTIVLIAVGAWAVGALAFVFEDRMLRRYSPGDGFDDRHSRRIRTQVTVVRRLTVALLVLCAIAGILMTFPAARVAGASVFASAGLLSIVAGLAAQTSLANVFAGMQIAFTDAIRQDDVVVLEGEWGRIEEITMTYVVVHVWDDRRLILPSTYFTTTPFENWTRRRSELLGTVELDLDWEAPVAAMRGALKDLLAQTPLWDHRVGVLQVTEAVQGYVQVRATVSAADAPTLFDLRCYVREGMVDWLQRAAPEALPRVRVGEALERADVPLAIPPGEDEAVDVAPVALARQGDLADAPAAEDGSGTERRESATADSPLASEAAEPVVPDEHAARRRGPRRVPRRKAVLSRNLPPDPSAAETVVLDADQAVPSSGAGSSGNDEVVGRTHAPGAEVPDGSEGAAHPADGAETVADAPRDDVPAAPVDPRAAGSTSSVRTSEASTGTAAMNTAAILTGENSASESALFSGTDEGVERSKAFGGPGEEVYAQREEIAERYESDDEDHPDGDDEEERRRRAPRDGDVTGNRGDGDGDGGGDGEGG